MRVIIVPFLQLVLTVVDLYKWCVIIMIILSLLQSFNVINGYNRFIIGVSDFLFRITEPLLAPIRRILPRTGVIDLSPLILILLLGFLENVLQQFIFSMLKLSLHK